MIDLPTVPTLIPWNSQNTRRPIIFPLVYVWWGKLDKHVLTGKWSQITLNVFY